MKIITCGFMGSSQVSVEVLRMLLDLPEIKVSVIWTNAPRPSGRGQALQETPVAALARSLPHAGIELREPERIGREEIEYLESHPLDFILVAAYGHILPGEWLHLPRLGCYNIHFSLLPRYRGASPIQAAILNGDTETGISIQKIVERLDAGDVVMRSAFPITGLNAPRVLEGCLQAVKSVLPKFIRLLIMGELEFSPQDDRLAGKICRKIKKNDGLLHSSMTATEISRKFLAYQPWPGVYFCFQDQVFIITGLEQVGDSSTIVDEIKKTYAPDSFPVQGLCLFRLSHPSRLLLGAYKQDLDTESDSTSDTIDNPISNSAHTLSQMEWLNISSIQKSGKKALPIKEFLNGCKWNFPIAL